MLKIMSQILWFNKDIKIGGKFIYFEELSKIRSDVLSNLFRSNVNGKPLVKI